jgi:hypothetical protein
MPKPSAIITAAAVLMNDRRQRRYTNDECLPWLNLALQELQEIFELNDIPVTHETSSLPIKLKAGIARLGFDTIPALPGDMIEILRLWESPSGQEAWVPMVKRDFLPHILENNTTISQFLIWSWEHGRVRLIPSNSDNDIKLDYIGSMFNLPIAIKDINVNLPFTNIETYLDYKTAALCAMFIAENDQRAMALDSLAGQALVRSLGIPIKGQQPILTRRRPFRASFKRRGVSY